MQILRALDPIEKLELRIADLYEWFSENLHDDPEMASIFFRMSVDEAAHANLVKFQKRLVSQNMKLFGNVTIDVDDVQSLIGQVESIRAGDPPSAEEALRIGLEIEHDAAEAHYRTAVRQASTGAGDLFGGLSSMDCAHCDLLEKFAAERSYSVGSGQRGAAGDFALLPADEPHLPDGDESGLSPEVREMIDYFYAQYERMDYYELLDVKDYATGDMIKHAFHARARDFHPDRFLHLPDGMDKKLTAVFGRMTNAYSILMNPDKRREYEMGRTRRPRR